MCAFGTASSTTGNIARRMHTRGSKPIVISRVGSSPTVDRSVKELPSRSPKGGRFRPPWFLVRGTGMSVRSRYSTVVALPRCCVPSVLLY